MAISHGIGPDNIEIVVTELDALANVDFETRIVRKGHRTLNIVRVGTSGSLQEDLHIGDYVIAEKGIGFDGILNFYADRDKVCDLDSSASSRPIPGGTASGRLHIRLMPIPRLWSVSAGMT